MRARVFDIPSFILPFKPPPPNILITRVCENEKEKSKRSQACLSLRPIFGEREGGRVSLGVVSNNSLLHNTLPRPFFSLTLPFPFSCFLRKISTYIHTSDCSGEREASFIPSLTLIICPTHYYFAHGLWHRGHSRYKSGRKLSIQCSHMYIGGGGLGLLRCGGRWVRAWGWWGLWCWCGLEGGGGGVVVDFGIGASKVCRRGVFGVRF